jgi:hypothetical protein
MASPVQQATPAVGKAVASLAPAFGVNAAVGNLVIIPVAIRASGVTVSSISGLGATWSAALAKVASNSTSSGAEIWAAIVVTAGTTITVNFSGATAAAVQAIEWNGYTVTTDGTNAANQGSGTSLAPGSITTANANDLITSTGNVIGITQPTDPGAPWNALTAASTSGGSGGSNVSIGGVYQTVTSTGSFNPSYTIPSSGAAAAIVAFKAVAVAGGITRRLLRRFARVMRAMQVPHPIRGDSPVRRALIANAHVSPANAFPQPRKLRQPPRSITWPGPHGIRGHAPEVRAVKANAHVSPANAFPQPRKLRRPPRSITWPGPHGIRGRAPEVSAVKANAFVAAANASPPPKKLRHPPRSIEAISPKGLRKSPAIEAERLTSKPAAPGIAPRIMRRKALGILRSAQNDKQVSRGRRIAKVSGAEQFAIAPKTLRKARAVRKPAAPASLKKSPVRRALIANAHVSAANAFPQPRKLRQPARSRTWPGAKGLPKAQGRHPILANAHVSPANAAPPPKHKRAVILSKAKNPVSVRPSTSRRTAKVIGVEQFAIAPKRCHAAVARPAPKRVAAPRKRAALFSPPAATTPSGIPQRLIRRKGASASGGGRPARIAAQTPRRIAKVIGAEQAAMPPKRKRGNSPSPSGGGRPARIGRGTQRRAAIAGGSAQRAVVLKRKPRSVILSPLARVNSAKNPGRPAPGRRAAELASPATVNRAVPPKIIRRRGTPLAPARRIPSTRPGRRSIGGATRPLFAPRIVFKATFDRTIVFGNCALDPATRFNAALNPPLVFNQVMLDPAIRFGAALDPTIAFGATLD